MHDVIRAEDVEVNSNAIQIPDGALWDNWTGDSLEDKNNDTKNESQEKDSTTEEDKEWSEDNTSDRDATDRNENSESDIDNKEFDLNNITDEELEQMSDEELDELLSSIEEDQEEKTEAIDEGTSQEDIDYALKEKDALLKSVSDRLESKIKENADLKVQLAEKNIFGWDWKEEIMILRANIDKAKWGDEEAKTQALAFLDKMRKEITWKTFGEADIDKETDAISESNSVKPLTDPSTPSSKDLEEDIKVL